jgi:hypothetical protein
MQHDETRRRAAHYAKVLAATTPGQPAPAPAPEDGTATQEALAKWLAAGDSGAALPDGASSRARGR